LSSPGVATPQATFLSLLERIEAKRKTVKVYPATQLDQLQEEYGATSKVLYWIYTRLRPAALAKFPKPALPSRVPISELCGVHLGLKTIIQPPPANNWWCVYSGRGTITRLRDHHFGIPGDVIGCLGLPEYGEAYWNPSEWGVRIVKDTKARLGSIGRLAFNYAVNAENLERAWRLHYGWPILCRK